MKCPYCTTENREDREACYHCGKDISMLRLIANKARHHYNVALEHADRQRYSEALAELEHCLELDHSFVPAHVVMGTVYAKMEKFDEAERCWRTALALDPNILKAHEYLDKGQIARRAVPLLRRLRWWVGAAVAATVLFAILMVWQLRPTSEMKDLRRVALEIENGNLAEALDLAQRLDDSARSAEVRHAARVLASAVGQRYESAAMNIFTLLLEDKPIEAHELYQRLVAKQPPPDPYKRQLDLLDQKASAQAMALADSWRRQFDEGTIAYDDLTQRATRLRQTFPQPEVAGKVTALLASARQTYATRILKTLPASPLSTTQTLVWLGRLRDLAKSVPESRTEVASANMNLLAGALGQIEQRLKKAVAAKDAAAIRGTLDDLARLTAFGRNEESDRLIQRAREDLRRIEVDRFKTRLTAVTAADIPQLGDMIASFEKTTSVTVEKDTDASGVLTRARRRLAADVVNWCDEREQRFQQRKVTKEESQWIADRAEFALRYSAAKSSQYTRDCVMFCAAVAWQQLGNTREALGWVDRLEKTYPDSSYVSSARRLRQQIEKGSKPPAASPSTQ
jgi:tetratricopeptide (TPR) repeat protein